MAKLTARGRTEVVRLEKSEEGNGQRIVDQVTLCSDGAILTKTTWFENGRKSNQRGWNLIARTKKSAEEFANYWRERGYTRA